MQFTFCLQTKAAVGKGGRGGRGKAPAAAAPAALDDGIDGGAGADGEEGGSGAAAERFDWDSYREACIEGLTTAIGLDLRAVWPMGLPEEVSGAQRADPWRPTHGRLTHLTALVRVRSSSL